MIELKEFNIRDALLVCECLPLNERRLRTRLRGEKWDAEQLALACHGYPGMKWVFVDGSNPLAIGGFAPVTPGTFRTWFYAHDGCWMGENGREITRVLHGVIQDALKLAHRIETITLADQEKARAWYPRIGLTYESTLPGYGANGEAAVMYVALRDAEKV